MAHKTKIIVRNRSDNSQQFMIFNDKPAYSESVGEAWINVWGRSPGIGARNGSVEFSFEEKYFAVCGMELEALGESVHVKAADFQAVFLGTGRTGGTDVPMIIKEGGAIFEKTKLSVVKKDGSFGINTGDYDMNQYKYVFCGLGMANPLRDQQEVLPVSVWQAMPNQKFQITPKRVYYISTGKFTPGTLVDVTQLGKSATIDFTGRKETVATLDLTNNLDYLPVVYSFGN